MAYKVRKAYSQLNIKTRMTMITLVILFTLTVMVFVATAGSGISFSGQTPVGGSVFSTPPNLVSVDINVNQGSLVADDIFMKLNGSLVSTLLDSITGGYRLSHVPEALKSGVNTVFVEVYDSMKGTYETTNWSFTVDAAPKVLERFPAAGATLNITNPKMALRVKDTYDQLNASSVTAKLNGVTVGYDFLYKGYYDTCLEPPPYIITDKKEGTVTIKPTVLENGTHTVEICIADIKGNVLVEEWSLYIESEVKFSNITPVNNVIIGSSKPAISVRAVDGTIDMDSIKMFLNGEVVTAGITPISNGYNISYTPENNLLDQQHTVMVSMFDTYKGVYETISWKFTIDATPKPSQWKPAKGSTLTFSNATISLYVKDTFNDLDNTSVRVKINDVSVGAAFAYAVDSCQPTITYKNQGTIEFNSSGLQDGLQNVEVSIADVEGNVMTETWSFNIAELPVISNLSPANKSELTSISQVSAVVMDNTAVDWSSVKLYINNSLVSHTVDEITGTVTYDYDFTTGNYNVRLEAKDLMGNRATAEWSFVVSSTPPTLTKSLYLTNGMEIINGMLRFHAQLDSTVEIKDTVTLTLNGEPLDFNFRYQGYVDSCTGENIYVVTSTKTAYVDYNKLVPDGDDFTLVLTAEDKFGNSDSWFWTFTVRTLPTISNVFPFKYGMQELQPTISATVKDNDSFESIVLKFNGIEVNADYDLATGKLTYTPPVPLENESNYTVSLTATDRIGLTATQTWGFNINTYPDMFDSSVSFCLPCHEKKSSREPYEAVHRDYLFWGHDGNQDCGSCHNYVTSLDLCGKCHDPSTNLYHASNWPPHGLNPDKEYSPISADSSFPLRVTTNRENWDCIICHQPGVGTRYKISGSTYRLLNNHDIPQLHVAPLTPSNESCIQCHARSLTREHAREGRKDKLGNTITCLTCHVSTEPLVVAAINNKDASCEACHENADHESFHFATIEPNCATCHSGTLTTEHMYNELTTAGKDLTCKTCHSSERRDVNRTIAQKRLNCTGCHNQGHGVYLTDDVPADIPHYPGFRWTSPMEAELFDGDTGIPTGYENGQVLITNRRSNVTVGEIWDYYFTSLTAQGFTLQSVPPDLNASKFNAEYTKQNRGVHLYCFNTVHRDWVGSGLLAGYRLEIWYK